MTWGEFKNSVEEKLKEEFDVEDVDKLKISYIDISGPDCDVHDIEAYLDNSERLVIN